MMKFKYVFLFVFFLVFASCTFFHKDKKPAKPNIIVFLADDLGYGDLGCYGNPIIKTPHLDQLASEGVLFTDCHSGGTVCSPSRYALLTGRHPYRGGFYYLQGSWGTYLHSEEITIAELLKTAGYETCYVGKWHLSRLENKKGKPHEPTPGDQGFNYWFATTHNAFDGPKNTKEFIRNGEPVGQVNGWYCDVIVKEAIYWLNKIRDKNKPFFLMVASHEPHAPIDPPEKYSNMYDNGEVDKLEKTIKYGRVKRPVRDISKYKKEYYGTVSQLDNAFGVLMKSIDSVGLRKNTFVFFTSDNGPEYPVNFQESQGKWKDPLRDKCFGTPGILRGMKRFPYEGGHRVPAIARWPGVIPAGIESSALLNGTDILPTFCALAGVKPPYDRVLDGKDAFNAFLGKPVYRKKPVLWLFPLHSDCILMTPHLAMREGKYTLIGWFPQKNDSVNLVDWMKSSVPDRFELYNIKEDPGQYKNIIKENPIVVKNLIPLMNKQWINIRDEGPWYNK